MELAIDQLNAGSEIVRRSILRLQRAIEAVEDRQHLLERIGQSIVAKILLLFHRPFAVIVELGLKPSQAIQIARLFVPQIFELRISLRRLRSGARLCSLVFALRQFVLEVEMPSISISFIYFHHWGSYSESFSNLSKSRAMYDTAVMVC